MIRETLLAGGAAAAIILPGCGGNDQHENTAATQPPAPAAYKMPRPADYPEPVTLVARQDNALYHDPFFDSPPRERAIKAGSKVTAFCYQGVKRPEADQVFVRSGTLTGFVVIDSYDGSKDITPSQGFNLPKSYLRRILPDCHTA